MKLFFDARYTRTDYHDGISRYSAELGNALYRLSEFQQGTHELIFIICDQKQKKWFPHDARFIQIHDGASWKEPFTAFILNKHHPDVVYSPMQTIGTLGRRYISVLTAQDMIYYRHPQAPGFLPWHVRMGWWLYHQVYWPQRLLLHGGDIITTVSKTSAAELHAARMTKKPIHVIYNAPQQFTKKPHFKEIIEHIVYMGSFMPYKNVETLIRGMQWLPGRTLHLLSRIRPERLAELEILVPEGAHVIFHNGVSDEAYEAILTDNAVLATASLDEGYGLPIAEALASGVPAVISDTTVFHEVGGDGALYFDPRQPKAFAAQVKKLDTKKVRDKHIKAGREHMMQFHWQTSAETLLRLLPTE